MSAEPSSPHQGVDADADAGQTSSGRPHRSRRRRGRRPALPAAPAASTPTKSQDNPAGPKPGPPPDKVVARPPKPSDLAVPKPGPPVVQNSRPKPGPPGPRPDKNRRRRTRRPDAESTSPGSAESTNGKSRGPKLRTVRETSAGGLVISTFGEPYPELSAALIGRVDRRGRMMWSLPKGHIETGETAEQTAVREIAEETGITGSVVAPLGKIDYWFVSEGRRIHKTVHHYLLRSLGGELSDADYEVAEVAWVPLTELPRRLTYSDERRLARMAEGVIADLMADPTRLAQSEAESIRTEPNAYERAAAARNQRRNDPPPPARSRRRRRRGRRSPSTDD
ncbi:NUDIX hydrolase [Gordonia sp. CPCC 205333]|uniref:NUDIX hydrolase n=1 Tax=Gordonia sp. CPCC 205333 TaxID=3140790 RepID=UPI003AF3CBED